MRRLGIATKLYLAFGSIFLLAGVAALVGWQGFQRIADSQNSVIDQAIPGLRQAHTLAAHNASIGAATQQLARAGDEAERKQISSVLFAHVESLNALLDEFQQTGFAAPSLQSLRDTVGEIDGKLRRQNQLVRRRIQQKKHLVSLEAKLVAATDELNELADSLVANAAATTTAITSNLYELVERDVGKQQLYNVFDRLVEVDIDAMERMYELRLRSANLRGFFNAAGRESDLQALALLRQRTSETLSILKRRVSEINDPQRRERANQLLAAMEVDNGPLYVYGIFETRISLLETDRQLAVLAVETGDESRRLNDIVNELNVAGGALINRVSTTARESLDTGRNLFNWISIFSLLVAAVILWGFVKRNVIRRLLSLESATRSITAGDYDVEIVDRGSDELANLGAALSGFRDSAIEKRKVEEELRQHKTHLEELVEKRTEQLRETNEKLSDEVRNHDVAREKAEQANRAKTAFLATMSHELRTPLSGALGTLRLLSDTTLEAQQLDYVHTIDAANTALLDIVNDILGYSQLEAGKLKIDNRVFELPGLLRSVVELMAVPASENGNSISLQMAESEVQSLLGDAGKLQQILINLIGNAIKFTENGSITLIATSSIDRDANTASLRFVVRDTGIGIAPDRHEEIFRAFTQVDTSIARQYGGIGLGLAICDRLVVAMGGTMHLESESGAGTRIGFDVQMALGESLQPTPALRTQHRHSAAGLVVLMVEDDAANRMVTGNYLQNLGHRVIVAKTGEQAISVLNTEPLSLVLLDISLPGIDGLDILKFIRAHVDTRVSDTPVIAMSAHVFTEEVDLYLGAGMNGFLGKPFSLQDLDDAIGRVVDRGSTSFTPLDSTGKGNDDVIFDRGVVDQDIDKLGVDTVDSMVEVFLQTGRALHSLLLEAIDQKTLTTVEGTAHKLRGAAGNFGLHRLCSLLAEIEAQAKVGIVTPPETLQQLRGDYDEAIEALVSCMRRYKETSRYSRTAP